jgi:hypothetical protein
MAAAAVLPNRKTALETAEGLPFNPQVAGRSSSSSRSALARVCAHSAKRLARRRYQSGNQLQDGGPGPGEAGGVLPRPGNPRPAKSGPRFPFPAESGIGDSSCFPAKSGIGDSLPARQKNRESGDPIPIQGPREGACSCYLPPATAQGSSSTKLLVAEVGTCQWLSVDMPWHQSLGRPRPESPSHSPPSPRPSRHPPSAGP